MIARWQALDGGLSSHAWDYRIEHAWQSVSPGVAVAHTGELTDRERAWAAVLHAGKDAALSGDVALAELDFKVGGSRGLWGKPDVDVAVPVGRNVAGAAQQGGVSVLIHRVTNLGLWVPTHHRDVPMVSAHAAVLHACAWAPTAQAGEWRLAAAVQQRLTAVPLLRSALARMPKLPRRALIREVLDDVELGAHAASELAFLRFLPRSPAPAAGRAAAAGQGERNAIRRRALPGAPPVLRARRGAPPDGRAVGGRPAAVTPAGSCPTRYRRAGHPPLAGCPAAPGRHRGGAAACVAPAIEGRSPLSGAGRSTTKRRLSGPRRVRGG